MRRVATPSILTACIAFVLEPTGHAKPPPEAGLVYTAPASCPPREAFEARLAARRRALPPEARLAVRVQEVPAGVVGELSVIRAGSVTSRRIEAARCADALDALALIAALLLAPMDAAKPPEPMDAAKPPERKPRARASTRKAASASVEAAAPSARPSASLAPATPSARPTPVASESAPVTPPAPAQRSSRFGGALRASGLLASGVAPALRPGVGAALGISRTRARFAWSSELGVRYATPHLENHVEGAARFRWWSALLGVCAGTPGEGWSLHACAQFEAGRLRTSGLRTLRPQRSERAWLAAGPGAILRLHLLGPVGLEAGLATLFPLLRDRFLLAGEAVHTVPKLTVRAEIGLLVRIL